MKKLISLLLVLTLALSLIGGVSLTAFADEEIIDPVDIIEPEGTEPEIVEDEIVEDEIVEDEIVEDEIVEDEIVEDEIVELAELESEEAAYAEAGENSTSGGLTIGGTYALFVDKTHYLLNNDSNLEVTTANSGAYSTSNPRGAITPAAGTKGGYTFTINSSPLGVVDGKIALAAGDGEWFYENDVLSYRVGDTVYYVAGGDLSMGSATGAEVKLLAITTGTGGGGDKPSGSGSGSSGGGAKVYETAITEAAAPNLVFVEAPHWVNLTKEGHETEKEVVLQARFPDGVTADAMTFSWSFGELTKEETILTKDAVDGVFTSRWTVSIADLDVGVYPVSCTVTYSLGDDIIVSDPVESDDGDSVAFTYTLGNEVHVLVETSNPGKPTVTLDGKELATSEDQTANPPVSYITDESLKSMDPGEYPIVITAEDKSEEATLTIVDPYASVSTLSDGYYIISFESDGATYAIGLDGKNIVPVSKDEAAVWYYDSSTKYMKSGDYYLSHNKTTLTTSAEKGGEVSYSGTTFKMKAGGADRNIEGIDGTAITVKKDAALNVVISKGPAPSNEIAGDSYTYTLGIEKDLKMPGIENEIASVTISGTEVDYKIDETTGEIVIAAAVLEAEKTGSYTIAITDADGFIVSHKLTVQDPPTIDVTVNVVLANGVQPNSLITFSDVHESWTDVGTAVKQTIIATGKVPALVIATGDFNNDRIPGNKSDYITGCVNEVINRVSLQLAGIDTVWVSGNHDNGFATQYTNFNLNADLGINLDDYASGPVSGTPVEGLEGTGTVSGTGIIFDTRSAGYAANADSSQAIDQGLVVIGLNYEDGDAFDKNNYGDGTEEEDSVYKHIEQALENIAANYNGELVVISSHAGLHAVGIDADSAKSASKLSGGNEYSITNSAAVVKLVNKYADTYGMDIMWFFGHDHSKKEEEFIKLPGATITSMGGTYGEDYVEELELSFTYAHSGYVGSGASSAKGNNYTYLTWDGDEIIREERSVKTSDTITARSYLAEGENHAAGYDGTLSFKLERDGEFVEINYEPMTATAEQKAAVKDMIPEGYSADKAVWYDISAAWTDKDGTVLDKDVEDDVYTLVIPYPAGTDAAGFEFKVIHIGEYGVENLNVEEIADGLRVRVTDLSPFMVLYKAVERVPADNGNSGSKDSKGSKSAPKTGDDNNIALWAVVLVLCAGTAVALPRRKFEK